MRGLIVLTQLESLRLFVKALTLIFYISCGFLEGDRYLTKSTFLVRVNFMKVVGALHDDNCQASAKS